MVKAEGYGHGLIETARILSNAAAARNEGHKLLFGTATAEEALILRAAGISNDILVVGGLQYGFINDLIKNRIISTVLDNADIAVLGAAAAKLSIPAYVHMKIDTGMHRLGFYYKAAVCGALNCFSAHKNVILSGVFTHYATADSDINYLDYQYGAFLDTLSYIKSRVKRAEYNRLCKHGANTGALLTDKKYRMDMVRAGLSVYGFGRGADAQKIPLKPVMSVSTRIVQVSKVAAGEYIGYGNNHRLSRDSVLAVVRAGYGDGYKRALSNKGQVCINNQLCPVIGNVCMDMLTADVTDLKKLTEKGGTAYLINGMISAETLSEMCGTVTYDILTSLSRRANRRIT